VRIAVLAIALLSIVNAAAEPVSYTIDPAHTHPAFEADHLDGVSVWRGLFKHTTGTITLDRQAQTGTVDVDIDVASVDFGNDALSEVAAHSSAPPVFEATKYPVANFRGTLGNFRHGAPTIVTGQLMLHGVTRPVTLNINSFKCIAEHPSIKRPTCGADAVARIDRSDFGITVGKRYGFRMAVTLRVQVEAFETEAALSPTPPEGR